MRTRAWWMSSIVLFLALLPAARAQAELEQILVLIQSFFSALGIIEPAIVSLVRIGIIVIVAVIIAELGSQVGARRAVAGTIGVIIAAISVLFIPSGLLIGIVATYTVVFSTILILIPNALLLFLVYGFIPGHTVFWEGIRLVIIFIVLILEGMALAWFS